jgi:ribokinase
LGSNELSRFVLEDFVKEGVDISQIIKNERAGPFFAFIIVDEKSGQRTIWWTDEQVLQLKPDEIAGRKEIIASAKFLLVDDYQLEAAIEAARLAGDAGVGVVLDAENSEGKGIDNLIQLTDILIVSEEFASGFSGKSSLESSAQVLLELGPRAVVITLGAEGSFCKTAKESFHQPAFQVKAIDTTGCGDVFHGGFIYGLLQDWPLPAVAEFASAVAALKCRGLGGRATTPTLKEVRGFLGKRGSQKIKRALGRMKHTGS